ncbi:hypothetical protein D3C87_1849170 [compost metagenome]
MLPMPSEPKTSFPGSAFMASTSCFTVVIPDLLLAMTTIAVAPIVLTGWRSFRGSKGTGIRLALLISGAITCVESVPK